METRGVGNAFEGTATGLTMALSAFGSTFALPLVNSLADWQPSALFTFWAALALFELIGLAQVKKEDRTIAELS